MRLKLRFVIVSFVMAGIVAVSASALSTSSDSASSIRGSLGASLADLSLDNAAGFWAFAINALFALTFVIAARVMIRRTPRPSGRTRGISLRAVQVAHSIGH